MYTWNHCQEIDGIEDAYIEHIIPKNKETKIKKAS